MKNLNEDINRLRQIMSYDRSRSLLISESQYSIEDSIEIEEQNDLNEDSEESNVMTTEDLMGKTGWFQNFLGYELGKLGYERGGVKGVVDALDGFVRTNDLKVVLKTLESLKGKVYKDDTQDPPVMIPAIAKFVELYKEDENGDDLISDVESVGTRTLDTGAEDIKKKIVNLIKSGMSEKVSQQSDSNLEDMPKVGTPGKGEEPGKGDGEGCPTEEDVLSGKVVLSKNSMNGKKCNVVTTVQNSLLKKLGKQVGGMSLNDEDFGIYGPKTVALVVAFQSLNGLKVDGIVGQNTMKALLS